MPIYWDMADIPPAQAANPVPGGETASDDEILHRIQAGERDLYSVLLRRYNQRLFRAARAILRRDDEAEDVVQQAWLAAFEKLEQFRHESSFVTWLTRIAVNEALGRLRTRNRRGDLALVDVRDESAMVTENPSPEEDVASREVEEMGTSETAVCLGVTDETVRVRLHRARHMLQEALTESLGVAAPGIFRFDGSRCDRITRAVLDRLGLTRDR
jgi:RNA polymerase sigma-70 factor (ECF subfamily)